MNWDTGLVAGCSLTQVDVSRRPPPYRWLQADLRALVIRMATENPTWGYTSIQRALTNLGHRVGRSTIARILRAKGPSTRTAAPDDVACVCAGELAVARGGGLLHDRGVRGPVTYYTAFVPDVQSRRVLVIGCTPYPDEAFVIQWLRQATGETGLPYEGRILLCDRDPFSNSGRILPASSRLSGVRGTVKTRGFRLSPRCIVEAQHLVVPSTCFSRRWSGRRAASVASAPARNPNDSLDSARHEVLVQSVFGGGSGTVMRR